VPRDEDLHFFVDETSLGVAHALAKVRGDVVHPGHRRVVPGIPKGALDTEWMPIVAELDLVVISPDPPTPAVIHDPGHDNRCPSERGR
jgi:hypothetical protein